MVAEFENSILNLHRLRGAGSGTGPILLSQATFVLAHIANSGPVPLSPLARTLLTRSTFPVRYPVRAPERGPRLQTHAQRRNLRISVRPGHRAPAATLPAIPAAAPSGAQDYRWFVRDPLGLTPPGYELAPHTGLDKAPPRTRDEGRLDARATSHWSRIATQPRSCLPGAVTSA